MASLYLRGRIWWMRSFERGEEIRCSMRTADRSEAEARMKKHVAVPTDHAVLVALAVVEAFVRSENKRRALKKKSRAWKARVARKHGGRPSTLVLRCERALRRIKSVRWATRTGRRISIGPYATHRMDAR